MLRAFTASFAFALLCTAAAAQVDGEDVAVAADEQEEAKEESGPQPKVFTLRPLSMDFGDQPAGESRTRDFTFRNVSEADLPIVSVEVRGLDSELFSVKHDCGAKVSPRARCTISVTFLPKGEGKKEGKLKVIAGGEVSKTRILKGKGIAASASAGV